MRGLRRRADERRTRKEENRGAGRVHERAGRRTDVLRLVLARRHRIRSALRTSTTGEGGELGKTAGYDHEKERRRTIRQRPRKARTEENKRSRVSHWGRLRTGRPQGKFEAKSVPTLGDLLEPILDAILDRAKTCGLETKQLVA